MEHDEENSLADLIGAIVSFQLCGVTECPHNAKAFAGKWKVGDDCTLQRVEDDIPAQHILHIKPGCIESVSRFVRKGVNVKLPVEIEFICRSFSLRCSRVDKVNVFILEPAHQLQGILTP